MGLDILHVDITSLFTSSPFPPPGSLSSSILVLIFIGLLFVLSAVQTDSLRLVAVKDWGWRCYLTNTITSQSHKSWCEAARYLLLLTTFIISLFCCRMSRSSAALSTYFCCLESPAGWKYSEQFFYYYLYLLLYNRSRDCHTSCVSQLDWTEAVGFFIVFSCWSRRAWFIWTRQMWKLEKTPALITAVCSVMLPWTTRGCQPQTFGKVTKLHVNSCK